MGYVIWGAGNRGTNLCRYFKDSVNAFIESNQDKIGSVYMGKAVISFEDYLGKYAEDMLIVSPADDKDILAILRQKGISCFFRSNECPSELVDAYQPEILDNIEEYMRSEMIGKAYVVGLSIYGILVARILRRTGCECLLVSEETCGNGFCRSIYEQEGIQVKDIGSLEHGADARIFVASGKKNAYITDKVLSGEWEDLFYLGRFLPESFVDSGICQFKDKHKNRRCFIVATGPSVRIADLDMLCKHHELCISMNKIFYAFDQTDWRPDYYVGEDFNLLKHYAPEIKNEIQAVKFLADSYEYYADAQEQCFRFHVSFSDRNRRISGGEDFSQGYMCGYSVAVGCLYLAMYMGFSPIYIIGADLRYSKDFSNADNHFYRDRDTVGKANSQVYSPFYADVVIENYKYILKIAQKRGIEIYNATRGGILDVFPRADFDGLF